jgi:hypothetical protein
MASELDYGPAHTDRQTFVAIGLVGSLLIVVYAITDFQSLVTESADSLNGSSTPSWVVTSARCIALGMGLIAVGMMFRVGPGTMQVLLHEEREVRTLHPAGFEKFVTFSSWTLLSNILYFASALAASLFGMNGGSIPQWLELIQVNMFVVACGSAFLTATVVRYIILPDFVNAERDSQYMFQYHEQVMHNFAAMFLAVEVMLVAPVLHPQLALSCVGMGLFYVAFAYLFAYKGGGYYAYSFIDPRKKHAPFIMLGLAGAIAVFYLGILLASRLVEWNVYLGSIVLALWVSLIVQFWSNDPQTQSSS